MKKLWQIACGDTGRDYEDLFLRYDVMLIGPGDPGPYEKQRYEDVIRSWREQLQWFVERPAPGDLVLLRKGHRVTAVGRLPDIEQGYVYREEFDDVLGWDLQHTRRVVWSPRAVSVLEDEQPVFDNYKQQRSFHRVRESRLTDRIPELDEAIESRGPKDLCSLLSDPDRFRPLDPEELGIELFEAGLSMDSVERVLASIRRSRRLHSWYGTDACPKRPTEMETVAHVIIPLMTSLGWAEQLLAVEWQKIDLAVFDRTPTETENCVMIVEAKSLGTGLGRVFEQAKRYVDSRGLSGCRKIVCTDGSILLLYRFEDGNWGDKPHGYVNLNKVRKNHVYPEGISGVETLIGLMPSRVHH